MKSLPSLGAWIEVSIVHADIIPLTASLPSLGAWIEVSVSI